MVIKLALFMNEPLRAHGLYQQEIQRVRMEERRKRKDYVEDLEEEIKQLRKTVEGNKKGLKKTQEKLRQKTCEVKSYQKKLEG